MGLRKISSKEEVKYIGVTAVKIVGHEKYLFLEVYRNKKKSKETPLVRIVLTKRILAHTGRGRMDPTESGERLWRGDMGRTVIELGSDGERKYSSRCGRSGKNKKFCKTEIPVYNEKCWWEYVYKYEKIL